MSQEHGPWGAGEMLVVGPRAPLSPERCLGCGEAAHTTQRLKLKREHEHYRSYRGFRRILAPLLAPPYRRELSLPFCLKCPRPTRRARLADRVVRDSALLDIFTNCLMLGVAARTVGFNIAGGALYLLAAALGVLTLVKLTQHTPLRHGVDGELFAGGLVRLTNVHPSLLEGLPTRPALVGPHDDELGYLPSATRPEISSRSGLAGVHGKPEASPKARLGIE